MPGRSRLATSRLGKQHVGFNFCTKRRSDTQENTLAAVFNARMSYLETFPELAANLQKAQTAWVEFRNANCAYLRSIARRSYADEAFQNCVLMKLFRIAY
jgi:uncharacterized protein YecT (DUF1311 family)